MTHPSKQENPSKSREQRDLEVKRKGERNIQNTEALQLGEKNITCEYSKWDARS